MYSAYIIKSISKFNNHLDTNLMLLKHKLKQLLNNVYYLPHHKVHVFKIKLLTNCKVWLFKCATFNPKNPHLTYIASQKLLKIAILFL